MVISYFYLLFTLFSWQIYSKSSSGSLPGLTLLFRSQMSVTPFVLGALLPLGHRDRVISWSQACFSWGSLLPIRVSFQGIRILEQVYGGSTVLATVCLERLYSTCALEWSLELAVLSEVWRYSFIVFKFPVFLLTSWSWSFVCKLLALFPARRSLSGSSFCPLYPKTSWCALAWVSSCMVWDGPLWSGHSCPLILRKFEE